MVIKGSPRCLPHPEGPLSQLQFSLVFLLYRAAPLAAFDERLQALRAQIGLVAAFAGVAALDLQLRAVDLPQDFS